MVSVPPTVPRWAEGASDSWKFISGLFVYTTWSQNSYQEKVSYKFATDNKIGFGSMHVPSQLMSCKATSARMLQIWPDLDEI
jgi:hypothetical protein